MKRIFFILLIIASIFAQGDKNLMEKARAARKEGDIDKAHKYLGDIITDYPKSELLSETYFILAEIAISKNKHSLAIKHYLRAIEQQDKEFSPRAYFKLAKVYTELGNDEMALYCYVKLINIYPKSNQAPVSRSFIKKLQKKIAY